MSAEVKTLLDVVNPVAHIDDDHPLTRFDSSKEKLMTDLKMVVVDAEQLLKEAADSSSEAIGSLRTGIERRLGSARERLERARGVVRRNSQQASDTTRIYVQNNPWKSAGILAAAGVLLGVLLARR